jgi:hypothetical protein
VSDVLLTLDSLIKRWPKNRPAAKCGVAKNCALPASYVVSYPAFSSNNRKELVRCERAMCADHARKYAAGHGLEMPSAGRMQARS